MLKIYMLIIVVGLLGGVVYGAYAYYQDTQQRIATLQQNNAKLETVAKTNEQKTTIHIGVWKHIFFSSFSYQVFFFTN